MGDAISLITRGELYPGEKRTDDIRITFGPSSVTLTHYSKVNSAQQTESILDFLLIKAENKVLPTDEEQAPTKKYPNLTTNEDQNEDSLIQAERYLNRELSSPKRSSRQIAEASDSLKNIRRKHKYQKLSDGNTMDPIKDPQSSNIARPTPDNSPTNAGPDDSRLNSHEFLFDQNARDIIIGNDCCSAEPISKTDRTYYEPIALGEDRNTRSGSAKVKTLAPNHIDSLIQHGKHTGLNKKLVPLKHLINTSDPESIPHSKKSYDQTVNKNDFGDGALAENTKRNPEKIAHATSKLHSETNPLKPNLGVRNSEEIEQQEFLIFQNHYLGHCGEKNHEYSEIAIEKNKVVVPSVYIAENVSKDPTLFCDLQRSNRSTADFNRPPNVPSPSINRTRTTRSLSESFCRLLADDHYRAITEQVLLEFSEVVRLELSREIAEIKTFTRTSFVPSKLGRFSQTELINLKKHLESNVRLVSRLRATFTKFPSSVTIAKTQLHAFSFTNLKEIILDHRARSTPLDRYAAASKVVRELTLLQSSSCQWESDYNCVKLAGLSFASEIGYSCLISY